MYKITHATSFSENFGKHFSKLLQRTPVNSYNNFNPFNQLLFSSFRPVPGCRGSQRKFLFSRFFLLPQKVDFMKCIGREVLKTLEQSVKNFKVIDKDKPILSKFTKAGLHQKCVPVNFAKSFTIPDLQRVSEQSLLSFCMT